MPDFKDLDKISENKETSENKENTEKTEYKIIKPSKHKISDLTKDNKKVLYSENSVFSYEVPEPDDMITKEEYLEDKDE